MAFFGKSEAELKQLATELEDRKLDLVNRESDIKSGEATLAHERTLLADDRQRLEDERSSHAAQVKREAETIAAEKAALEKRRTEIALLEARAKADFANVQRETFEEVVEKRQTVLDFLQDQLNAKAAELAKRLEAFHEQEADLARRTLAVTEREQKADAGFADKARTLAEEATRQHQANQAESDRLGKLRDQIAADRKNLEEEKAALAERVQAVRTAEHKRDNGYAEERASLEAELREKRIGLEAEFTATRQKRLSEIEAELTQLKAARLADVSKAEQTERDRVRAEIAKEREDWAKQQEDDRRALQEAKQEIEKLRGESFAQHNDLERRKAALDKAEQVQAARGERLEGMWQKRNDELEDEIETRVADRRQSLELAEASLRDEISRLRDALQIQTSLTGAFEQLKRQLGSKDPAEIIRDLNSQTDELKRLREELATRPTEEMRERYQEIEREARNHKARADQLMMQLAENEAAAAEVGDLRRRNSELDADNKSLAQRAKRFEDAANAAQSELDRLRAAYERPAEIGARYKEIEMPHIKAGEIKPPVRADIDEMAWLDGVRVACDSYGLHFNPRILKAFHTALKTAEWSPLTVLAGVSGTGKSELPRLYSHFGGLMFEPLSVQPNWDSQESMLGFFNSIDNRFDAQPVLRFLAQSQKDWSVGAGEDSGYPGLKDAICLVLLDEMNLAHPELYFAEFLSKLELRRGMKGSDVPVLPVKIGAGMPPYQLPLGRNVLWAGTMNQDETTKSLSDKVLDRSIVIHFPRPTALRRRLKLAALDEKNRGALLHKASWQSWLAQGSSFSEEDVKPFMEFIGKMNDALAVAGRAIGHRVWQSVEYYMANYPDVRAAQKTQNKDDLAKALHVAFEDQLVQKVMPKLRGIDTRGKSRTDCLDKILGQINSGVGGNPFNLAEDFNRACELGYGQFIWQSANYLCDSEADALALSGTPPNGTKDHEATSSSESAGNPGPQMDDGDLSRPPSGFNPTSADREKQWMSLPLETKRHILQQQKAKAKERAPQGHR
jgi:hypothetical protein